MIPGAASAFIYPYRCLPLELILWKVFKMANSTSKVTCQSSWIDHNNLSCIQFERKSDLILQLWLEFLSMAHLDRGLKLARQKYKSSVIATSFCCKRRKSLDIFLAPLFTLGKRNILLKFPLWIDLWCCKFQLQWYHGRKISFCKNGRHRWRCHCCAHIVAIDHAWWFRKLNHQSWTWALGSDQLPFCWSYASAHHQHQG